MLCNKEEVDLPILTILILLSNLYAILRQAFLFVDSITIAWSEGVSFIRMKRIWVLSVPTIIHIAIGVEKKVILLFVVLKLVVIALSLSKR